MTMTSEAMTMTSDARSRLSKTIRGLRERLLIELGEAADREYRLTLKSPKLKAAPAARRKRLEDWLAEQVRAQTGKQKRTREDFRRDVEKQAAYTLLNRLVILRIMEALGLRRPKVVTGGWNSQGYKDFRELARALVRSDDGEAYPFLLQLIYEDLAFDLPGLYGSAGIADLIPVPSATIRGVVEALDDTDLESCWADDMTLGWIYQYWNDPEREALDKKINEGGKIEPHEIASKTQMFTERYMVDWLLQNSLGPMWLAMCRKHGWTPEVEADGTLERLERRRVEWRAKRDAGEVSLTDLMPLETNAERRWAYYVPQPIPADAVEHAPASVRDLKILDPAVGSGHFLVVAFDLLFALYEEEARHRGEASRPEWSESAIVERILEHNLHGIDLDPRAVQIAAAALWLKAQSVALRNAQGASRPVEPFRLKQLNLVASNLGISQLPDNDPSLVELRRAVEAETGIPGRLTMQIVEALRGADHLGSLLKVDQAIEQALDALEADFGVKAKVTQIQLFPDGTQIHHSGPVDRTATETGILSALEEFLSRHTSAQELGLRMHGEQLASGVRFARMLREETYDIVVANPPYQGTSKMKGVNYVASHYKRAKADLFAAFLQRGLELVREHGVSAMLTMRNWMFIKQYAEYRDMLFTQHTLRAIGDVSWGAFREMRDNPVAISIVEKGRVGVGIPAVAIAPTNPQERVRTLEEFKRKAAGMLCQVGSRTFDTDLLKVIPDWPLVYWWDRNMLRAYQSAPLIGDVAPARKGLSTGDNTRFLRKPCEIRKGGTRWSPLVKGADGREWIEPCCELVLWHLNGLEVKTSTRSVIRNPQYYLRRGVAFSMIGSRFSARVHRNPSLIEGKGSSVFPRDLASSTCAMNSTIARGILQSLNPGIGFEVGDVNRLPLFPIASSSAILGQIDAAFTIHESHREPSVEFTAPGPSPWRHAQEWAQLAVDRPEGAPLPEYVEELDPEPATDHLSFAVGVALGRFGAQGEGILDPAKDELSRALPHGVLFLDGSLDDEEFTDSLGHAAAQIIHKKWAVYRSQIDPKRSLRGWLREKFFPEVHKGMYENRPIHWPLSSAKKTFVAWVTIHRWNDQTLRVVQGHLVDTLRRLDGEITDLIPARSAADRKSARAAEDRYDDVKAWRDELAEFLDRVRACAEHGPPPPDPKKPEREADARYVPDLDDGVMINSAALWPLLEPQWKDPKKWWKELVAAKGKKDYDWSHLAMRYWPARVDEKCRTDPSLGVAHGCFWKYHPARAWAWELRLQDEIGPGFRIEEAPYRGDGGDTEHRTRFLRDHPAEALEILEKEVLRRRRKQKQPQTELKLLEPGLWSAVPGECWDLELKLAEKQQAEFRLLAPDEPEARATFERAHPERVKSRSRLLRDLRPPDLFAGTEDEENVPDVEDLDEAETGEDDA